MLRKITGAVAARRHAVSLAFGGPLSLWALDAMVGSLADTVATRGGFDPETLLADSGLGGDAKAIAALHRHRFRDQAQNAARTVPHYRELFERLGLSAADITPGQVPVTSKEQLRERPDDFVSSASAPFVRATTTGTTGTPTVVHFSRHEWLAIGALAAFPMIGNGLLRPDDVVHLAITPRAVMPNHAVMSSCAAVGAVVQSVGMVHPDMALSLLSQRRSIAGHKDRVSFMTGNPTYVGLLVEHGLANGWRPEQFGIEQMFLGGELVTDGLRRRMQAVFGPVEIRQSYATTELLPFGGDICRSGHLHFEPTSGLAEIIDPDTGQPAEPGAYGTIVATPFRQYRQTTVLLRFDTGDAVQALPEPATCELRNLPATGMLLGKFTNAVRHEDGTWTFARPVAEALEAVDAVPLPARYGFWGVPGGVEVEVLIRPGCDEAAARRAIGDELESRNVPLRSLITVEDRAKLSNPAKCRCDTDEGQLIELR